MSSADPFLVLPEEIWEAILDLLEDPQDILNLLTVIPQLRTAFRGKLPSWLISNLIPFLFPKFLSGVDLNHCRLVSKRWRNAIHTTLHTHSDRHPYHSPQHTSLEESHFNYKSLPNYSTNFRRLLRQKSYLLSQVNPQTTHSPFPGGHFHLKMMNSADDGDSSYYLPRLDLHLEMDFDKAASILADFGHHVFFIDIQLPCLRLLDDNVILEHIMKPLFECFSYLPNLKSLKLETMGPYFHDEEFGQKRTSQGLLSFIEEATFPFSLETVDMWDVNFGDMKKDVHKYLIKSFVKSSQVKKLTINAAYWLTAYGEMFPDVTELCVLSSQEQKLKTILKDLHCPQLNKVKIRTGRYGGVINIDNLLEYLVPYQIEALDISGFLEQGQNRGSSLNRLQNIFQRKQERAILHSVTSLKHIGCEIGFKFFKSFPNLQYLTVTYSGWEWDKGLGAKRKDSFAWCLYSIYWRGQHGADNMKLIWETLPNLKMLTLLCPGFTCQCVRECSSVVFSSVNTHGTVHAMTRYRDNATGRSNSQ